jgi:hypothetical protein
MFFSIMVPYFPAIGSGEVPPKPPTILIKLQISSVQWSPTKPVLVY